MFLFQTLSILSLATSDRECARPLFEYQEYECLTARDATAENTFKLLETGSLDNHKARTRGWTGDAKAENTSMDNHQARIRGRALPKLNLHSLFRGAALLGMAGSVLSIVSNIKTPTPDC